MTTVSEVARVLERMEHIGTELDILIDTVEKLGFPQAAISNVRIASNWLAHAAESAGAIEVRTMPPLPF